MLTLTPLEETRAFRELREEGYRDGLITGMKEGIKEGRQEGRQEGIKAGLRDGIRTILSVRFGEIPQPILGLVNRIDGIETLEALLQETAQVPSLADFQQRLLETNGW